MADNAHVEGTPITAESLGRARGLPTDAARAALTGPLARFAGVGVLSTLAYAALFVLLRGPLGPAGANAAAWCLTAVGNTALNRRATFGVRGRARLLRHHTQAAALLGAGLVLTSAALAALHAVAPGAPRGVEIATLQLASAFTTVVRFVVLRRWVFARR